MARGTNNFQGGMARINEGGRGELVGLPNGTTVVPHDLSAVYMRESAKRSKDVVVDRSGSDNAEVLNYWGKKLFEKESSVNIDGRTAGKLLAKHVQNENVSQGRINNLLMGV